MKRNTLEPLKRGLLNKSNSFYVARFISITTIRNLMFYFQGFTVQRIVNIAKCLTRCPSFDKILWYADSFFG